IPGFLTRRGAPVMSFGVMGGNMQSQGHVQMVTRVVDYNQNPQSCSDGPRWIVNNDFTVSVEEAMPAATVQTLRDRGHQLVPSDRRCSASAARSSSTGWKTATAPGPTTARTAARSASEAVRSGHAVRAHRRAGHAAPAGRRALLDARAGRAPF